jgi:hypothetical protein
MPNIKKVNRENLLNLAHVAGYDGITGMCKALGITRQTAYEAVTTPKKFPHATPKIEKALNAYVEAN